MKKMIDDFFGWVSDLFTEKPKFVLPKGIKFVKPKAKLKSPKPIVYHIPQSVYTQAKKQSRKKTPDITVTENSQGLSEVVEKKIRKPRAKKAIV